MPAAIESVVTEGAFSVEKFVESFEVMVESAGNSRLLRDSVLALAFTGKLVSAGKMDLPVAQVVDAIEKAWLRCKRKEVLLAVESDEIPPSPSRWTWVRLGNLAELVGGVTKGRDLKGRKRLSLPYLRVANVQRGFLDLDEMKEIEINEDELPRYRLESGDILFTEGGDWDKLGRSVVWRAEIDPCIHQNHVFRARMVHGSLNPAWFSRFANSPLGRNYFETAAKRTTNLASINMTQLRNCPMPLPPVAEQKRIVARVDQLMALIDDLEQKQIRKRQLGANFTKASLEALTGAESPEEFDTAWKRVVENWGVVVDRGEKVARLRAAVLELAIRGRLLRGDTNAATIFDGNVNTLTDVPFELPPAWRWMPLRHVAVRTDYGTSQKAHLEPRGIPVLRMNNIQGGRLDLTSLKYVPETTEGLPGLLLAPGSGRPAFQSDQQF